MLIGATRTPVRALASSAIFGSVRSRSSYSTLCSASHRLRAWQSGQVGDAEAQFALSLVWGHGLHGYPTNLSKAAEWRAKALSNRRFMPITQYTAAFNGQPSRVNIINVPTYDVTLAEATAVDACIAWLSGRTIAASACGEGTETARRRNLWAEALRQ